MMDDKQLTPRELLRKGYEQTEQKPDVNTKTAFDEILKTSELDGQHPYILLRRGYANKE